MKRLYNSDINRIMSLIYEDEALPAQMPDAESWSRAEARRKDEERRLDEAFRKDALRRKMELGRNQSAKRNQSQSRKRVLQPGDQLSFGDIRLNLNSDPVEDQPLNRETLRKRLEARQLEAEKQWEAERKREAAAKIKIDLSALDAIRRSSTVTMNKLITEEDMDLHPEAGSLKPNQKEVFLQPPEGVSAKALKAVSEKTSGSNAEKDPGADSEIASKDVAENVPEKDPGAVPEKVLGSDFEKPSEITAEKVPEIKESYGLTAEEQKVICTLIENGDPSAALQQGSILSVVVDSINEKLFDEFGDTVIEDGNPPMLLEDYREELCGMFSLFCRPFETEPVGDPPA